MTKPTGLYLLNMRMDLVDILDFLDSGLKFYDSYVRQAMFCLRVCQVVFPRVLRFSPHLLIDLSRYE